MEELFEKNKALVFYTIKKLRLYPDESHSMEDWEQIGNIGLWNAVKTYKNKTKFSTYAVNCIKNELVKEIDKISRKKRKNDEKILSLDNVLDDDTNTTLYEFIGKEDDYTDLYKSELLDWFWKTDGACRKDVAERILNDKLNGTYKNQKYYAKEFNLSHQRVFSIWEYWSRKIYDEIVCRR